MRAYIYTFFLIILVFLINTQNAQAVDHFYNQIGVGYGIWKPMALDEQPNKPFLNVKNASTSMHVTFILKIYKNHGLRTCYFQWQQEYSETGNDKNLTLHHTSLDAISILIPESPLSPYVSYGISTLFCRPPQPNCDQSSSWSYSNLGYNIGTGLYFHFYRHFAVMFEYQFLYSMFPKDIMNTQNYSGPKLSGSLQFCF